MRTLRSVVYIVVDDLRPQLNVAYGQTEMVTPSLDVLASRAAVFERGYAQFAVCAPSRNSFMTGRRPDRTRCYNFMDDFREVGPDWVTLPQYFKDYGYTTLGGGKTFHPNLPANWDLPYSWDAYFPYDHDDVCNATVAPVPPYDREGDDVCTVANETALYDYRLASRAIDWYRQHNSTARVAKGKEEKPLFLAVGFRRPHLKSIVPKSYFDLYEDVVTPPKVKTYPRDRGPIGWCCAQDTATLNGTTNVTKGPYAPAFDDFVSAELRRGYYAAVTWTDHNIGRLLRVVDFENTVILVHGDHGYELGEMANWRKRTNLELGTRVPLLVAAPGVAPSRVRTPVELVDVYRTLADLAGLPPPPAGAEDGVQGKSLRPYLLMEEEEEEEDDDDDDDDDEDGDDSAAAAFSQFDRCPGDDVLLFQGECDHTAIANITYMGYSIRTSDWRYTVWLRFRDADGGGLWEACDDESGFCERELYDHRNEDLADFDALELVNVAAAPTSASTVARLHARLRLKFDHHIKTKTPPRKNNILWFVVDDLRPQLKATYGQSEMSTPFIDDLASSAFVFDLAFAQFAVCAPSRSSFMTGRRPSRTTDYNFVDSFRDTVGADWITLPQFFKDHGYLTRGAAKTFHPALPANYDLPYSWHDYLPLVDVKCDAVDLVPPYNHSEDDLCTVEDETKLQDYKVASAAIEWLNDFRKDESYSAKKNFFFAVGMRRPHLPWVVPKRMLDLYNTSSASSKLAQPSFPRDVHNIAWSDEAFGTATLNGTVYENQGPWTQAFPDDVTDELRKGYAAAVSWVDEQVGRVVRAVDDDGSLSSTTIVALVGDHGYSLGSKACWTKHTNFDLGTRVPLIIRLPGHDASQVRVGVPVELVDLYRTFADLVGLLPEVAADVQGKSLRPHMLGVVGEDDAAFSQYDRCPTDGATTGNVTRWHGPCKRVAMENISYMGMSMRTSAWRYTAWMRFDGANNRGRWEDCDDDDQDCEDCEDDDDDDDSSFCARELYAHAPGDEVDFERSEASNVVEEHPIVAAALHAKLRRAFEDDLVQVVRLRSPPDEPAAIVSRKFASISMDWWPCGSRDSGGNWCNASVLDADLSDARLRSAAALLAPGLLRVGGSMDVEARYAFDDADVAWCRAPRPFRDEEITLCAHRDRVEAVLDFADDAGLGVVWGLPYPGAYASSSSSIVEDSVEVPPWNATDALALLEEFGHRFAAVELAEELAPPPNSASYDNLVAAYRRLRDETTIEIRGPCVGMAAETNGDEDCLFASCEPSPFLAAFLEEEEGKLVDVLCVHSYDNSAGGNWTRLPALASQLPRQLASLRALAASSGVTCGECGPHNEGGLTVAVASSYWYLDVLGRAARLGTLEFGRQAFLGANYGLLDNDPGSYAAPNSDFWVAATWSRLMGHVVLGDVVGGENEDFHVYAHCSPRAGWLALAFVNVAASSSVDLDLRDLQVVPGDKKLLRVEEWLFTTPDIHGKSLLLNGDLIDRDAPVLRHLEPARHRRRRVRIPPLAFGFLRFPTSHPACTDDAKVAASS